MDTARAVEPESVQEVIDSAQRSELYFAVSSDSAASGGSDADEAGTRDDAGKEDDAR